MKKIFLIMFFAMMGTAYAGQIYLDAEVNYTNVTNRSLRAATDIAPNLKVRLNYSIMNGLLELRGSLNNFMLTGQAITSVKLMDGLTTEPFVGAGWARSINGDAAYGDLGVDFKYKLFPFANLIAEGDLQIYTDSYMLFYRGGFNIPVLKFASLDLLYSSLLTNNQHQIGFGGRINLVF